MQLGKGKEGSIPMVPNTFSATELTGIVATQCRRLINLRLSGGHDPLVASELNRLGLDRLDHDITSLRLAHTNHEGIRARRPRGTKLQSSMARVGGWGSVDPHANFLPCAFLAIASLAEESLVPSTLPSAGLPQRPDPRPFYRFVAVFLRHDDKYLLVRTRPA